MANMVCEGDGQKVRREKGEAVEKGAKGYGVSGKWGTDDMERRVVNQQKRCNPCSEDSAVLQADP